MSAAVNYYLGVARGKTQNPGNVGIATSSAGTSVDVELRTQIDNGTIETGITKEDVILALRAFEQFLLNNKTSLEYISIPLVNPIPSLLPTGYWKFNTGISQTIPGFCSQWDDQSGNGNHLVQATGSKQPIVNVDSSLTFDGVDDLMQVAFTLAQPYTLYVAFRQIAWVNGHVIADGRTLNMNVSQTPSSPRLKFGAGAGSIPAAGATDLAVGVNGVVCAVGNGASSVFQLAGGASTSTTNTGSVGTQAPGGFTIGAQRTGSVPANIVAYEAAVFPVVHNAATRLSVIQYLCGVIGQTIPSS